MSVNTSEEYLDELLQAIDPIINSGQSQEAEIAETKEVAAETISQVEPMYNEEPVSVETVQEDEDAMTPSNVTEDEMEGNAAINDLLASLAEEELEDIDEDTMSEEDVESMLNAVSSQTMPESDESAYAEDVKELLKQFTEDEDLSDIQDILDKNDNGEALDNSMLELPDVEVFQLEEENDVEEDDGKENKASNPISKVVGGLSALFKKRKEKKDKKKIEIEEQDSVEERDTLSEVLPEVDADSVVEMDDEGFAELDGMSLDDLFNGEEELILDEDMSDIEQLLSEGTFEELEETEDKEVIGDTEVEISDKKARKKRKKKEKKESVFAKVLNMLTEEIDEPVKTKGKVPEADETGVTDENLNILEELSAEEKKKAKKEEKQNKKAKKKGKGSTSKSGDGGEDDGQNTKNKKLQKTKKPKKKREKKEKPRKVQEITKPEKKLPRKRVISTLVLCLSILVAILILQGVVSDVDNNKEAQFAYDSGDYATCFANLATIERNEEQEELYQKSLIIMSVQRKWESYNNFMMMNNEVEALNSLLEGVTEYRNQEALAVEWGVHGQVVAIYQDIMDRLQGYGLSETDVEEILAYESKVTYTKRLDSIVNGTPFVVEDTMGSEMISTPQPLQDILPGEEDFLPEDTTDIMNDNVMILPENVENDSLEETVTVGSNPVDIFSGEVDASYEEQGVTGGQNVGNGSTNISSEVTGQNVVVGVR